MARVFIPIDDCTKENGCLQVLRGSHKMGRVDHSRKGEQKEIDQERLKEVKEFL